MGKWDHRSSRRFFRPRRSPGPPSIFYDLGAPLPDFHQDGIPLWEKKFCTLIGLVPWQKIVDSKKFMYSHASVLNWNDSAAEEAFQNAKRRYWAEINRLPCDIIFPSPDTPYLDHIDWNPYIDPELVKELDREYFAPPDERESDVIQNKRTKTSADGENSWECVDAKLNKTLENKLEGWNKWNDHVDDSGDVDDADNPWECSLTRRNGGLTESALDNGAVKPWGWNQAGDHMNHSRDWHCGNNAWDNDGSANDKGWGKVWDNSWKQHQSRNWIKNENSWNIQSSNDDRAPMGRGWRNREANEWGWKQHEKSNISGNLDFRRNCGQWNPWNQSWQKREGSHQHTSGYKDSRFQRDDCRTGHYWRRENSKKRVSFALQ